MAILKRVGDGAGDMGARSEAIKWTSDGKFDKVVGRYPTVGCSMLVGSISARSYSDQDYWLTTEVTEILEEKEDEDKGKYFKFKTGNSIYEYWE